MNNKRNSPIAIVRGMKSLVMTRELPIAFEGLRRLADVAANSAVSVRSAFGRHLVGRRELELKMGRESLRREENPESAIEGDGGRLGTVLPTSRIRPIIYPRARRVVGLLSDMQTKGVSCRGRQGVAGSKFARSEDC